MAGEKVGEVVEMKRKVSASINRFGRIFRADYRAGPKIESSDPTAAFYVDGTFRSWLQVGFHEQGWSEIYLDASNEEALIDPEMLGIHPATEEPADHRFLSEAEEYILALLTDGLQARLLSTDEEAETEEEERIETPHDRGKRVLRVWHNHGKHEAQLPELVAIEVFDALEYMGRSLAEALDEDEQPDCAHTVRETVTSVLSNWREYGKAASGDEDE